MAEHESDTISPEYAERLVRLQTAWWKRVLPVQAPYRWNLRRLEPGFTLDLGCGIGRNLAHLGGAGVGIDHNPRSVAIARARGFRAYTPEDFAACEFAAPGTFDSLLLAHVAEHMNRDTFAGLVREHLAWVKPGGKLIVITPQEVGFASDASHVEFVDFESIERAARAAGVTREKAYSFPFPRPVGRLFIYNEFVWVGRVATAVDR